MSKRTVIAATHPRLGHVVILDVPTGLYFTAAAELSDQNRLHHNSIRNARQAIATAATEALRDLPGCASLSAQTEFSLITKGEREASDTIRHGIVATSVEPAAIPFPVARPVTKQLTLSA